MAQADVTGVTDIDEQTTLAKVAYMAYGQSTGFKNFLGNPMPTWDALGDTIQAAWVAAAGAVASYLTPPALDETGYVLRDRSV